MRLSSMCVAKRTVMVPADSAAHMLGLMMEGYLACRTIMTSQRAGDALRLHTSETLELTHAFERKPPMFDSLPPRHVAVMLLHYGECGPTSSKVYLNALAFMACMRLGNQSEALGAQVFRISALFNYEADFYGAKVKGEACSSYPDARNGCVQLCVRWMTSNGMRCEFKDMPSGVSLDDALSQMKNFLISIKVQYRAPISDMVLVASQPVCGEAWVTSMYNATHCFAKLMEGQPVVVKSEFLKQCPEIDIDSMGVYVRISEKAKGAAGLHDASAFHGFLVGNSAFTQEIRSYCENYNELPMPDADTHKFCLHTCAVQVQAMHLGPRVSLYAQGGVCGQPFLRDGNYLYRFDPAIVPLEDVLVHFVVSPCTRQSAMPSEPQLENAQNLCINRAFKLFHNTFGSSKATVQVSGAEYESRSLCPISFVALEETREEAYTRAAFGIDRNSPRVLAGDAYNVLVAQDAPAQITSFLLEATYRFGINASVLDSLELAAASLQAFTTKAQQDANAKEQIRLRNVAEGAAVIRAKRKEHPPPSSCSIEQETTIISKKHVGSVLAIAGIKTHRGKTRLPAANAPEIEFEQAVTMMAEALLTSTDHPMHDLLASAARTAKQSIANSALTAIAAASAILRASEHAIECHLFLLHHRLADEEFAFWKVQTNGTIEKTTPAAFWQASPRRVFIAREARGKQTEFVVCDY